MEHLWAPWRMAYIEPQTSQPQVCIFCTLPAEHRDAENYILYRGALCFMMLNRYPYNNGHLMIAPYQHVASIEKLDAATLAELMADAQLAWSVLPRLALHVHALHVRSAQCCADGIGARVSIPARPY